MFVQVILLEVTSEEHLQDFSELWLTTNAAVEVLTITEDEFWRGTIQCDMTPTPNKGAASNPACASRLQFTCPKCRVAELRSFCV